MGYPDGLAGTDIPVGARIFAAVDALDAMTDQRPYRFPTSWDQAVSELVRCKGRQFDPDVVDAIGASEPDLYRIHTRRLAA